MEYLEKVYWWKVDSFIELDEHAVMIELIMLEIIDQWTSLLEDGYPPRRETGRLRLYRVCHDQESKIPGEYQSQDFAKRCWEERAQLGYSVMVIWQGDEDTNNPLDWLTAIRAKDQTVFVKRRERGILDKVKAFALAFNRNHPGAWEYLFDNKEWYFADNSRSDAHSHSGGSGEPQGLSARLVRLHAQLGEQTAGLFKDEDGVYFPMVMNENTRKGFDFRVTRDKKIEISARTFSNATPVILLSREKRMETLVPKTVYEIVGWEVQSTKNFVMDVHIIFMEVDSPPTQKCYRLSIGELREDLRNVHGAVLICQSLDIGSTAGKRREKQMLLHDKENLERFWTGKIFCNPWINIHGNLEFLNGAIFSPSWIVKMGTPIKDPA
jgi:hypothetical protein